VGSFPGAPAERDDDLEPRIRWVRARAPTELARDVLQVRPRKGRVTVRARVTVELPEDLHADVEVRHRTLRALERPRVPAGDGVRLALRGLKRICRPQDGHGPSTVAHDADGPVPDEETVRLPVVRLDRGRREADEAFSLD
jgi:hypothetical protein